MIHSVKMPDDIDPERLAQLITAEREGRCTVFPCALGAEVWAVSWKTRTVRPLTVESFHVFDRKSSTVEAVEFDGYGGKLIRRYKLRHFGKTLFLNRADAEAALDGVEER